MSDHSISIVPKKLSYPDNEVKGKEILEWLISKDIIKAELSDCVLSSQKGYAISEGAEHITDFADDLPFNLIFNGVEIVTQRQVFDTGETGMEKCICPNCKEDIAKEDWSFIDSSICPLCNACVDINKFEIIPEWGFSDLGFTFWNWPKLKKTFIDEFREKLNCDVSIVFQHI